MLVRAGKSGVTIMPKKPWRTVKIFGPSGRFTRKQIRDAIQTVRAEREREEMLESETRGERLCVPADFDGAVDRVR
jgi:hypothetical protein